MNATNMRWWRRWYKTERWERMRNYQLAIEPHCRLCYRRGRQGIAATDVDHIKPHRGDAALFWDSANLQSLCHPCHSSIKQSLEAHPTIGTLPNGRPASPHHWWNKRT